MFEMIAIVTLLGGSQEITVHNSHLYKDKIECEASIETQKGALIQILPDNVRIKEVKCLAKGEHL